MCYPCSEIKDVGQRCSYCIQLICVFDLAYACCCFSYTVAPILSRIYVTSCRLSAITSSRLRDNNPNLTDLSDPHRPSKIGEMFSELYDNEWTSAYDELCHSKTEVEAIQLLNKLVMVPLILNDDAFFAWKDLFNTACIASIKCDYSFKGFFDLKVLIPCNQFNQYFIRFSFSLMCSLLLKDLSFNFICYYCSWCCAVWRP